MAVHFNCPNCNALYQLIKAEAGPETITDREIACRVCKGPLAARDGEFVLKYFLLSKAGRRQVRQKPAVTRHASVSAKGQHATVRSDHADA